MEQGPLLEMKSAMLTPSDKPADALDASQIRQVQHNFAALVDSDTATRIAAQRLADADRRMNDADRMIDLCIGIESLISGEPGDTTYKIKLRLAAVLASMGYQSAAHTRSRTTSVSLRTRSMHCCGPRGAQAPE